MSFAVDHVAVWTTQRDAWLEDIAGCARTEILNGWSPEGVSVARGVRFASGCFLDAHKVGPDQRTRALLGLRGDVDEAVNLARRLGWQARVQRPAEFPADRRPPWTTLSFRRHQGLLSALFVIDYHEVSNPPPEYAQPLYTGADPVPTCPRLLAVWLRVADLADAHEVIAALGGRLDGEVTSRFFPYSGRLYRLAGADLVVATDASATVPLVCRLDIEGPDVTAAATLGGEVLAVVGESALQVVGAPRSPN